MKLTDVKKFIDIGMTASYVLSIIALISTIPLLLFAGIFKGPLLVISALLVLLFLLMGSLVYYVNSLKEKSLLSLVDESIKMMVVGGLLALILGVLLFQLLGVILISMGLLIKLHEDKIVAEYGNNTNDTEQEQSLDNTDISIEQAFDMRTQQLLTLQEYEYLKDKYLDEHLDTITIPEAYELYQKSLITSDDFTAIKRHVLQIDETDVDIVDNDDNVDFVDYSEDEDNTIEENDEDTDK